jgi:hypothetical protein
MALSGGTNKRLYVVIITFLIVMIAVLAWFSIKDPVL